MTLTTQSAAPMRAPCLVIDDFLAPADAQAMRAAIEAHFGTPNNHRADTHMVWNYWFVPGMYTYLRAMPERVLGRSLAQAFHRRLAAWSCETLGLSHVTWPYLSLYVDGCKQGLHNDSTNGRFGFVYSLTKNVRKSEGGETLVWREDDYFGTSAHRAQAGDSFYEKITPAFNRLVLFDDRMPHAVQAVEGGMDPLEGRIVLHGHLSEGGPIVQGPLPRDLVVTVQQHLSTSLRAQLGEAAGLFHGLIVYSFTVAPDGGVHDLSVRLDRVRRLAGTGPAIAGVTDSLAAFLSGLRFPTESDASRVMLPIAFGAGAPLPSGSAP